MTKDMERLALEAAYDRQRMAKVETRLAKVETQNVKCESDTHNPPGKKTESRIEKVKSILKRSSGARTFQQLQKDLAISPYQFTRLVSHLDKRSFEVFRRAGGKHGEKVLKLRVRIMEGVVFT